MSVPEQRAPNPLDRLTPEWELDCANCSQTFPISAFEASAFCSDDCRATARAIRYGRRQVTRYGPSHTWREEILVGAIGRVPKDARLAEVDQRWNCAEPERPCDQDGWDDVWLQWVAGNRRQRTPLT
jgi:hypothetical protein